LIRLNLFIASKFEYGTLRKQQVDLKLKKTEHKPEKEQIHHTQSWHMKEARHIRGQSSLPANFRLSDAQTKIFAVSSLISVIFFSLVACKRFV
jgi:hypothetical protein